MNPLTDTITAIIRSGEQRGYIAECLEIAVVTQGLTVDETINNLKEAVLLHLEDEDLSELDRTKLFLAFFAVKKINLTSVNTIN